MTKYRVIDEKDMVIHSVWYCPNCTDGGDLFIYDEDLYIENKENHYPYYCKKCKGVFKIIPITEGVEG